MRDWFANLQVREQRLLIGGAVVLAITAFWLFAWDPVMTGTARAIDDNERKTQLLERARRTLTVAGTGATEGARVPPSCTQSLTLLVANTVRDAGLSNAYRSSSPFGNDGLRVSLENASFDQTVQWLGRLRGECGIIVDSGSFTKRTEPGRVDASIALERSPS